MDEPRGVPGSEDALSPDEVRQRAAGGAVMFALRGSVVRVIGFAANLVLARLLTPDDFGTVALGLTIVTLGAVAAEGGMGAALIQREEPPSRPELESMVGLSLVIAALIALVALPLTVLPGQAAVVTMVMVSSLPFLALRSTGVILLQRRLDYRPLVAVELVEAGVYAVWGISTAALGWGVWALATAVVVRTVVGTALLLRLRPVGVLRPRLSMPHLRPLLSFGAQFQAVSFVHFGRDQGLNVGTAAVGGLGTLGVWTLAYRFLQLPFVLFESLWRVSFPAMSRLVSAGEDPKPLIERSVGLAAVGTGFLVIPLAAGGENLIVGTVGEKWRDAAEVLPWSCLALMISGPISTGTAGYLFASRNARIVLVSALIHTALWLGVGLGLLSVIGLVGLGIGWLVSATAEGLILSWASRQRSGADALSPILVPLILACAATGAGVGTLDLVPDMGSHLAEAALALTVAEVVYFAMLGLILRDRLVDFFAVLRRGLSAASVSPRPSPA
jgi:O-antigen/teichoic acid export membrane protein